MFFLAVSLHFKFSTRLLMAQVIFSTQFTGSYIYLLTRTYTYLLVHILTYSYIYLLTRTYTYFVHILTYLHILTHSNTF